MVGTSLGEIDLKLEQVALREQHRGNRRAPGLVAPENRSVRGFGLRQQRMLVQGDSALRVSYRCESFHQICVQSSLRGSLVCEVGSASGICRRFSIGVTCPPDGQRERDRGYHRVLAAVCDPGHCRRARFDEVEAETNSWQIICGGASRLVPAALGQ